MPHATPQCHGRRLLAIRFAVSFCREWACVTLLTLWHWFKRAVNLSTSCSFPMPSVYVIEASVMCVPLVSVQWHRMVLLVEYRISARWPVQRLGCFFPVKVPIFWHCQNPRSRPICPRICSFSAKHKKLWEFGVPWCPGSFSWMTLHSITCRVSYRITIHKHSWVAESVWIDLTGKSIQSGKSKTKRIQFGRGQVTRWRVQSLGCFEFLLKVYIFWHCQNPRSRPICPKIGFFFCKNCRTFGVPWNALDALVSALAALDFDVLSLHNFPLCCAFQLLRN